MELLDRALEITAGFEGGSYNNLTNNFDGMGLSAGILQWCLGEGSLQAKIIKPFLSKYGSIDALKIFPNKIDFLVNLPNKAAVDYAVKEMHSWSLLPAEKRRLKPNWVTAWREFLSRPEVITIQKSSCSAIFEAADRLRAKWGMTSNFALFWFFDLLVQNGSLEGVTKPDFSLKDAEEIINRVDPKCRSEWRRVDLSKLDPEQVVLFIASYKRALTARSRYFNDVLARKGTIALGRGYVHDRVYILS
jgi:hypothetical protein